MACTVACHLNLDVGTSKGVVSSAAQKRKEVAKKVVHTLREKKNKESIEKAQVEQEYVAKEQEE